MEIIEADIIVIGAGMAGACAAARLAPGRRVLLLEMEARAGYHTTGRSAAIWVEDYGPEDVRALTLASRGFFENPPPGFAAAPLMHPRGCLMLAPPDQVDALDAQLARATGLREISLARAHALLPVLRPGFAVRAALAEGSFDMDVAALHQGFLAMLRAHGGRLLLDAPARQIDRPDGLWRVISGDRAFCAPVVVNAAGAWVDQVARLAAVAPIGIVPKRRTACIVDGPPGARPADWPLAEDALGSWYCRPEARAKLLVSPADATPSHPHDVAPEEIDIATGIDRMQQALDIPVRRVEHAWAGLRSFVPDGSLVIGEEPTAEGFFWMAGQGGYGIQTAPAAGQLLADLVLGRPHDARLAAAVAPARLRAPALAPSP